MILLLFKSHIMIFFSRISYHECIDTTFLLIFASLSKYPCSYN
jgi:uncharacterized membrane protein (DUF4010 family)